MLRDSITALARPGSRQGQDFLMIAPGALTAWAGRRQLSLFQAYCLALAQDIWPEPLERNFPTLSAAQQLRLCQSRVLLVGLGGLGGQQAVLLARLGVGRLLLADGDRFAPANLNRQLLATTDTLGQSKAGSTAAFLARINPALEVEALAAYLTAVDYETHLPRVDLVLDGLDSLAARRELLAAARRAGKPMVHGAVLGQDGQVTTILPEDPLTFEARYLSHLAAGAEPPPVLAPIVALVAALQVQEAVRLLLGRPLAYHGRLAFLDGDTGRLEWFDLNAPAP